MFIDLLVSYLSAKLTNKSIIFKFYRIVIISTGCFLISSRARAWYLTLSKSTRFKSMQRMLLLYMVR